MKNRILISILPIIFLASCQAENTPPIPKAFALPQVGDTTTIFMLEAKNSSDMETSYFALRYRWDTDANGTWDCEYSTQTSYTARFAKTGYQKYILEVADDDGGTATYTDSVFILAKNLNSDTLTDPRNGQHYHIVKIGSNWWMAENLRYGSPLDNQTPFHNDDQVEYLRFNNSADFGYYGSLYTWVEANWYPTQSVYKDICPPGWRIPTTDQWAAILKKYSQPFDVLYYFGSSSIENLGVQMRGYYQYGDPYTPMKGKYKGEQYSVRYWTPGFTGEDTTRYFTAINFTRDSAYFVKSYCRPDWIYHPFFPGYIIGFKSPEACYVRCIKQ